MTMENPYQPPRSVVSDVPVESENNSGGGSNIVLPDGVKGWSWGAFFWNWIWSIFNKTWIGLLALVPYVGFIFAFYLGFKGRELAWRNKRWESLEHFNRVQRSWSKWGLIIFVGVALLGIVAAIAIPAFQGYVIRARSGANHSFQRTAGRLRLPVPSALRASAAPEFKRWSPISSLRNN
ncbi:conserved hypothetical protein [Candidatus Accumulibacter aalborgensis]|uniref:Transmembrane protein n=1 Tax=Candidatus Accumulibacter aalborgensis TaxID=1860102 RepID=A0A1A8XYL0_9PROT|nr:hypothetical protein [Candidatus Accumulibacter aalborgensis]SBT09767.1 conserved hypothetical protein [Candidatus Accumulibacter aalborgensis]